MCGSFYRLLLHCKETNVQVLLIIIMLHHYVRYYPIRLGFALARVILCDYSKRLLYWLTPVNSLFRVTLRIESIHVVQKLSKLFVLGGR